MSGHLEDRQEQGGHSGDGTQRNPAKAAVAALTHDTHDTHDTDPASTKTRTVEPQQTQKAVPRQANGLGTGPRVQQATEHLNVLCGPLLNYRRMSGERTSDPRWHGSVLLVTTPGSVPEAIYVRRVEQDGRDGLTNGQSNGTATAHSTHPDQSAEGVKLYEDPTKCFWQFSLDVPFQEQESAWEYTVPRMTSDKSNLKSSHRFFIPSKHESMRIMFHSCNGFSVGTNEEAWSGPALWNDVLRLHAERPFHIMIGGGDQIYNDGVRVDGPLRPWTDIANPKKRREFPFNEDMRAKCDDYYFDNYVKWYAQEPFASANGQIPQLNIWDDHDIIDGFGSYTDHFMSCSVFRGIGGVAHKYYLLFQHHIPPPVSTYTTDAPQTTEVSKTNGTTAPDSVQLHSTYVRITRTEDPSYIIGNTPGPYVEERSRSIYCQLGKQIAFLAIDARTERTRHQVNYPETYDKIFRHADAQLANSNGAIKHLILLLGIPIAYPRMQWLENILHSPIVGPIRFLNKRFGVAGGFFNQFDGNVDLLDDLDDHYTARQHKKERKLLVLRLQRLARERTVRITILGGDVHLAALGRFYSNPELRIPAASDWRYIPNIVSSAITNKPPPAAVANLLAKRNKIHHLDDETDETLLELFDKNPGAGEPGVKPKTAQSNHATMPSRNYAIIAQSHPHTAAHAVNGVNGTPSGVNGAPNGVNGVPNGINGAPNGTPIAHPLTGESAQRSEPAFEPSENPRHPLHEGERHAGTTHPAASGVTPTGLAGSEGLDVTIRVEINPSDREGHTQGYGFSVPALESGGFKAQGVKW